MVVEVALLAAGLLDGDEELASLLSAGSFTAETARPSSAQVAMVPLPPFPPVSPEVPPGFGEAVPPGSAQLVALGRSEGLASSETSTASGSHAVDARSAATTATPTA
ncbi:hypothetical protein [Streptomyces sp. NPDC060035]|uniref:hypothetical protein n=1 Tax=Streptomyces sp. NPDC060035 TaxID=3347044 RepID=UPI0036BA3427